MKKPRNAGRMIQTALLFFISVLMGACESGQVVKDMVEFDRAYVPALYYTAKNDRENAVKSMMYLRMFWKNFKMTYEDSEEFGWKREFIKIDGFIDKADREVKVKKSLAGAHDALEEIRYQLLEARRKNHIEYIMDYLTDYHGGMEAVISITDKKSPGEITEKNAETIRELAEGLEKILEKTDKTELDKNVFNFNSHEITRLKGLIDIQEKKITELKSACTSLNAKKIKELSASLKPGFMEIFIMFGNM